jgi:hypothetical protein
MVISFIINYDFFIISFFLILGSLINIYYYLNVFFNVIINSFFLEIFVYDKKVVFGLGRIFLLFFVLIRLITLGLGYLLVVYAMVLFYKS